MQRIWEVVWGKKEEEKEKIELTESFKKHVKAERRYKLAACLAFFVMVFGFGIPMWWMTTSTYRAEFQVLPKNRTIFVPVRIVLATTSKALTDMMPDLQIDIEANLTNKDVIAPLQFDFSTEFAGVHDFEQLENQKLTENDKETFKIHVAIIGEKEWSHFSATKVRLGTGAWSFIQWPEQREAQSKAASRITDLIWETLLDVPHLNTIIRRDLRQKIQGWQIAALPLSHQKRLVWDSAPLALNYRIQLIHLHENEQPDKDLVEEQKKTAMVLRKFAKLVEGVTNVKVTSEHLWDFEITRNFLTRDVQERWTLTHSAMEDLIKTVDAQMQTTIETGSVLRFVILETRQPVMILDQYDEDSSGLAVAAWGAILTRDERTESRAIAAMRVQMGMDAELSPGWWRPPTPLCDWEVARARLRGAVDNAMRATSAIRGLDEMTKKISNIEINDDVAAKANRAVELLYEGVDGKRMIDYDKLLEARQLADSAISNPSLLSRLYFPMDQRTAIIFPLAVPVVFPIVKLVYLLAHKTIFRSYL